MHAILDFFRAHKYRRIPETSGFKRMLAVEKRIEFTIIILFVFTASGIFFPDGMKLPAILSGFVAMLLTGVILAVWKQLLERGLNCDQCGHSLKKTAGKWIEIDSSERRIVVYSCETCRQYFYSGEEARSSSTGD